MANSKVVLADGRTLIDLTADTVTPDAVDAGITFHDAAGEPQVGTFTLAEELTRQDTLIAQIQAALEGKAAGGSGGGVQTATLTVTVDNASFGYMGRDGAACASVNGSYTCVIPSMVVCDYIYSFSTSGAIEYIGGAGGVAVFNVTGDATIDISDTGGFGDEEDGA